MRRLGWDEDEFEVDSRIYLCDDCGERVETDGYWDELDKERGFVLESLIMTNTDTEGE